MSEITVKVFGLKCAKSHEGDVLLLFYWAIYDDKQQSANPGPDRLSMNPDAQS